MATDTRLLLDTQVILWSGADPDRISPRVAKLLSDSSTIRYVSLVSAWEMQIKHAQGKLPLTENAERVFQRYASAIQARVLPIRIDHISALYALPDHHRDPFDRMIIAQALTDGLTIVSSDKTLRSYPGQIIW